MFTDGWVLVSERRGQRLVGGECPEGVLRTGRVS